MRPFLFALIGGLLGFAAGVIAPILLDYAIDWVFWLFGEGSGGSLDTRIPMLAMVLMLGTVPLGTLFGLVTGWRIGQ